MAGKWRSHGLRISYCEIEFCTCVSNTNSSAHTQSLIFPEKPGLSFHRPWEKRRKLMRWVWKTDLTQQEETRGRKEVNGWMVSH